MDVFEAIQTRKSIRAYQDKPVSKQTLERILDAARLAPSAVNIEPWHFIVVTDNEKRKALSKGMYAKFVASAPVVIVVCADKKASPKWYAIDAALALENMILAAVSEGLGTCCVGSFKEEDVKATLKVPDNLAVLVMLTVGYEKSKMDLTSKVLGLIRKRKLLSEVTSEEEYGKPWQPQPTPPT
jgi:nitroreductase